MTMIASRNGRKRILEPNFGEIKTAQVEMRSQPHIFGPKGSMVMHVDSAMVTVIDPGENSLYQRGMCFFLNRSQIEALKIDAKPFKFHGSENHHKFMVLAYGMHIKGINGGLAA